LSSDFGRSLNLDEPAEHARQVAAFRAVVLKHYQEHGRDLPWRRTRDPYRIFVSEMMLQQTQVARVLDKYPAFLAAFPDVQSLAAAPLAAVLRVWQGLGYNRRALALHRAAQIIVADHQGIIPRSPAELDRLPGVGPATAAALCAFAYDVALPFLETNIRSAILHFFFPEEVAVADARVLPLVELTLDRAAPRDWYYALMDYGAWVKRNHANPNRRSRHHAIQKAFAGSHRQLRAQILRLLLAEEPQTLDGAALEALLPTWGPEEVRAVLDELAREGFLCVGERGYSLA
jgi:A/G-specific adenine glycosylase